jgi:hypothetical protein
MLDLPNLSHICRPAAAGINSDDNQVEIGKDSAIKFWLAVPTPLDTVIHAGRSADFVARLGNRRIKQLGAAS